LICFVTACRVAWTICFVDRMIDVSQARKGSLLELESRNGEL
jgi:hypothetical protein